MTYRHGCNMQPYVYDDCISIDDMAFELEDQGQGQMLFMVDSFKTT